MCGIVAIFSKQTPIADGALEKATKRLFHRGPDGQKFWVSNDRRVGLGHARLSIIDLTTGDQPIANEDETLRIVVNGEFYGYEPIRKELEQLGHKLRTRSDSEIALHLYEDLGAQCLHRLRGEFAMVIWDSVNKTLFAARDRFGIKPLFYSQRGDTLYLASEVKALFAAGVSARWDCESIYGCAGIGGNQSRTLYDGIYQIPPGHFLVATDNQFRLKPYWDFNYPRQIDTGPLRPDEDYEEEFRNAFEEAVKLRLRADVPVGCYLSGGVDSCAIVAMAARHHQGAVHAYTLAFDHVAFNEADVAKEMAAKAGAEFIPIPIKSDDLADHFAEATAQSEMLCVNPHGTAKFLLSRAVNKAGIKVVLTGEGSDEILAGYMHFGRDMVAKLPVGQSPFALPATSSGGPASGAKAMADKELAVNGVRRLLGFVPNWMDAAFGFSSRMRRLLSDSILAEYGGREEYRGFFNDIDVAGQLTGRHPLHQSLYLWSKTKLPNYLLTILGDRMEMGHSVEGRVPFLDHRLVELARSMPASMKIRGMVHKYILRKSMQDVLTETVYARLKQPFWSPPATFNPLGKFNIFMQDVLRSSVVASMPFFDRQKVVALLDDLQKADKLSNDANEQVLTLVLSACVLQDRYHLSV